MGNLNGMFSGQVRAWFALLIEPVAAVVIIFASTSAIAQPFYIPSGSMEPTLAIGDYLVATKYAYGYSRYSVPFDLAPHSDHRIFGQLPKRGDVVVFRVPNNPKVNYVKRVIGLPGDTVATHGGRLFLNGQMQPLKFAGEGAVEFGDGRSIPVSRYEETFPGGSSHVIYKMRWDGALDDTPTFKVPPGNLFMMGDNRDDSLDSRVAASEGGVGFVPLENLVGEARWVLGSYDFLNTDGPATWLAAFRTDRLLKRID